MLGRCWTLDEVAQLEAFFRIVDGSTYSLSRQMHSYLSSWAAGISECGLHRDHTAQHDAWHAEQAK